MRETFDAVRARKQELQSSEEPLHTNPEFSCGKAVLGVGICGGRKSLICGRLTKLDTSVHMQGRLVRGLTSSLLHAFHLNARLLPHPNPSCTRTAPLRVNLDCHRPSNEPVCVDEEAESCSLWTYHQAYCLKLAQKELRD